MRNWAAALAGAVIWAEAYGLPSAGQALAEESPGDRIVRQMDESMTRAKDQYFLFDLVIEAPGKKSRSLQFAVTIKGTRWRRIEFLAPGDVRDMRILVLDLDRMYVYMPAYSKIRRVATHVRAQGFMGSAYNHDEMAIVTYGDVYSAKLVGEDDQQWKLNLVRRPGQSFPYSRLEMDIRKDVLQPSEIRYFNDKGIQVKTETRADYECKAGLCNPRLMTMVDHTRNDLKSELIRREWKSNTGVDDGFFTKRSLQRKR